MSDEMADLAEDKQKEVARKSPGLYRNFISLVGAAVVFASIISIVLLFLSEMLGEREHPYLGIFTYIILPAILMMGLAIVLFGMLLERRRRRRSGSSSIAPFPMIDLNDPRRRRSLFTFLGLTFVFLFVSAFGSYRAYEYTESVDFCGKTCHSVMKPELNAFRVAPHANIRCVDCHVGPGAGGYVRSKFAGVRQLFGVIFNNYSKPVPSPVHNMPAAEGTCVNCHRPEHFHGNVLKEFKHFGYDEANTPRAKIFRCASPSPWSSLFSAFKYRHRRRGPRVPCASSCLSRRAAAPTSSAG